MSSKVAALLEFELAENNVEEVAAVAFAAKYAVSFGDVVKAIKANLIRGRLRFANDAGQRLANSSKLFIGNP